MATRPSTIATIRRISPLGPLSLRLTARVVDVLIAGSLALLVGEQLAEQHGVVVLLAGLAVVLAYEVGFLLGLQATLGKLLAGLRVQHREAWLGGERRPLRVVPTLTRSLIVGLAVTLPFAGLAYAAVAGWSIGRSPLRTAPHDRVGDTLVTTRA